MQLRKLLIAVAGVTMIAGAAGAASADTPFQQHHQRRAEINQRLDTLNQSIREDRAEGEVSAAKARCLHHRVHFIRREERDFARRHNGHISVAEQARLNRQETAVRGHIPG